MPPSTRKNVHSGGVNSKASVSRMSTMCGESQYCSLSGRMLLTGMSEDADANTLPGLQQDPTDEVIPTVPLVGTFHDVDALKSQVRRLALGNDETQGLVGGDWAKDTASPSGRESTLSLSSDDTLNCDDCRSTGLDSNDTSLTADGDNTVLENGVARSQVQKSESEKESGKKEAVTGSSRCQDSGIKAGLVMSPVLLTEDVPVDVGASNRLSSVLENMSLPLLYLPTTKQLVNGDRSPLGSVSSAADLSRDGGEQSDKECNFAGEAQCNGSEILSTSHAAGSDGPGSGMFHTNSSSSDFDRLRTDPDQVTLNSVESFISNTLSFDPTARLYTDTSSLSSISTGTDFSVSAVSLGDDGHESRLMCDIDDGTFMDVNLHGRNSFEKGKNSSLDSGFEDRGAKPKKRGFSFLSRGIFSRKSKEESAPGWKLFGKVPPKDSGPRDSSQITSDYYAKQRANQIAAAQAKGQSAEVMSTTALILENRPEGLPSKSPEEIEKHRQEYEAMVEAAKKKEQRDLKMKKKKLQQQRRQEDRMVAAANTWNKEILPNWETTRQSKKVRDLWWMGLPPNVRGKVWQMAIGNDLNITHDLYEICHSRALDRIRLIQESKEAPGSPESNALSDPPSNKESSLKVIKLDISRTFPQLCIFQKGGPYHDLMHSLLGAYACYRPDVGYVQGMSFIAAILLLNMDVADAFVCFANLLNRPCQVTFFRMDEEMMTAYYKTFEDFFLENLPQLYAHFVALHITPNLYLMEWIFLLYSKSLPLDVACRVWDVYCRDGEEFLYRTGLGILKFYESILMKMDFIHAAQFLTKLPEDICADQLFKHIETIHMTIDKRKFPAVLAYYKENKDLRAEAYS